MRLFRRSLSRLLVFTLLLTMLFPAAAFAADLEATTIQSQLSDSTREKIQEIVNANLAVDGEEPILHPDLQNLTGDEEISVIVELSEAPVALAKGISTLAGQAFTKATEQSTKQKVVTQQQKFVQQLNSSAIQAKVTFTYNYAFNGLALRIKASQVKQLIKLKGVQLVEPDVEVQALDVASSHPSDSDFSPQMNTSNPFLDVPSVWNLGYKGQGVKVAVLDTGIDYFHPEFKDVYKGGHNFIPQAVDGTATGYARTRSADDPYETTPLDRPANRAQFDSSTGNYFYTEHGTHVAGTIAAQGNNPYGIKGLAPLVQLYAYRVLGAYGSGSNSGVIAGIDMAAAEHMDIINLSLGSITNSQVSSDSIAINNAALAGTAAAIATGNKGPNRGTIGSPGTAAFAISVGNSTVPEKTKAGTANVTLVGAATATSYNMNLISWKFGAEPADTLKGTYDVVAIPNYGRIADYTGLDVKGKVALISRGDGVAFVDKIANAKANGAVATIIHNFASGTNAPGPSGARLGDSFESIPSFDMSYTDGIALRTALTTKTATVTFDSFTTSSTAGDLINDSSSRGPANPVFDIKPDVTAPGTNIMSSVASYGKDYADQNLPLPDYSESYNRLSGTSMATPHVTGTLALLKSEHPDWTPFDLKVAISNTAKQLDVTKYDVFAQGAGRIQPLKAATAEALAYSIDQTTFSNQLYTNIKGSITFGNITPDANTSKTITKNIILKSLTGKPSDYNVTVQTTKKATGTLAAASVTVDKSSITLTGEQQLTVTLSVPKGTATSGNELLGYVLISNGTTNLNVPFAANFAPPTGLKSFTIDSNHISPNGDGKLDSTTVRYEFYDRQFYTLIELYDLTNLKGGVYGDGSLGWIVYTASTTTGPKTFNLTGNYHPWGQDGTALSALAPESVYALQITTYNATQTAIVATGGVPLYVKTSTPKIVADDQVSVIGSDYQLSGSIDDSYVKFGPVVEEELDLVYNVNENLHTKYELTDSNAVTSTGKFILDKDGKFNLPLSGLTPGVNQLKLIVEDAASNYAERIIPITSILPVTHVTGVTLDQPTLTFTVGGAPQALTATVEPADASNKFVTWSSSNPDVAEVDSNGLVTPGIVGTATITVTTLDGGFTATSDVTVNAVTPTDPTDPTNPTEPDVSVTSVTLGQSKLFFIVGGASQALTATVNPANATNKAVLWSSSNTDVATVDDNGVVTPVNAGTATITVTTVDGNKFATSSATVSVQPNIKIYAKQNTLIAELNKTPVAEFYLAISNSDAVNALDTTFQYDSKKFTLKKVELINQADSILRYEDKDGKVRLLAGFTQPVTSTENDYKDIIKLTLEPVQSIEKREQADIELISATTASSGRNIAIMANNTGPLAAILFRTYRDLADTNQDGKVSIEDLSFAIDYYRATSADANWLDAQRADVNLDGVVDIADITIILRYIFES